MPRLAIPTASLFQKRVASIKDMLRAVTSDPGNLQVRPQKHPVGQIISASDHFSADESPTERSFRTSSGLLYAQYYELWASDEKGAKHHLYQNYFHLFTLPEKSTRDQLFCLHAEPEWSLATLADKVKAAPHVHVIAKEERLCNFSKAHLPICYTTAESVLASLDCFDHEFSEALRVIKEEVIDRF